MAETAKQGLAARMAGSAMVAIGADGKPLGRQAKRKNIEKDMQDARDRVKEQGGNRVR